MKVCFVRDESVSQPGKYIIRPNHDNFHLNFTEGSFNVICARLFGITYAQYLRMCRDCYGAEIIGKGSQLPVAYFKATKELADLIKQLNERANLVLAARR